MPAYFMQAVHQQSHCLMPSSARSSCPCLSLLQLAALPDDDAAEAAGHSKRLQPGQQHGPVEPVSGAEEVRTSLTACSYLCCGNGLQRHS